MNYIHHSAMRQEINIEELIKERFDRLTPSQVRLAKHFLEHPHDMVLKSSSKVAQEVGTSESTVVRFCMALGFDGYADLQHRLRESMLGKIRPSQRLEAMNNVLGDYYASFSLDLDNVIKTRDSNSPERLDAAVEMILKAERVFSVGFRPSYVAALFFAMILGQIRPGVTDIDAGRGRDINHLFDLCGNDLVIGFSFPRYSSKILEVIKISKFSGSKIIAVTNSPVSPIGREADLTLIAEIDSGSYFNSMAGVMALSNCLISAVARKMKGPSLERLSRMEAVMKEMNALLE